MATRHFIVPATFREENGEQVRTPKYVNELGVNWSGVYLEEEDAYMIVINTREPAKLLQMVNPDVVDLTNPGVVAKARARIPRLKSATRAGIVNEIGKLANAGFDATKLSVMSD